ncbi:MAG: hypothetical protein AAF928_16560 [Myxococcota bacterium]
MDDIATAAGVGNHSKDSRRHRWKVAAAFIAVIVVTMTLGGALLLHFGVLGGAIEEVGHHDASHPITPGSTDEHQLA